MPLVRRGNGLAEREMVLPARRGDIRQTVSKPLMSNSPHGFARLCGEKPRTARTGRVSERQSIGTALTSTAGRHARFPFSIDRRMAGPAIRNNSAVRVR